MADLIDPDEFYVPFKHQLDRPSHEYNWTYLEEWLNRKTHDGAIGSGPIEPTYLIAAVDARPKIRAVADFACNGVDDQDDIDAAAILLYDDGSGIGGVLQFTTGGFKCADYLHMDSSMKNFWLRGVGYKATQLVTDAAAPSDRWGFVSVEGDHAKVTDLSVVVSHDGYYSAVLGASGYFSLIENIHAQILSTEANLRGAIWPGDDNLVRACWIDTFSQGTGIVCDGGRILVEGCYVEGATAQGLYFGDGILVREYAQYNRIIGNIVSGSIAGAGIRVQGDNTIVIGNVCPDGIVIESTADGTIIGGNVGMITDNGTNTVYLDLPVTTKGDLVAFDTSPTRLPVGPNSMVLVADSVEATGLKYEPRMNWRNVWASGQYEVQDVVRDGEWTMVANKQTTGKPAPVASGPPEYAIDPDPAWVTVSPTVTFLGTGTRFIFTEAGWINSWRVWIPTVSANNLYTAVSYDQTDPDHVVETSIKITPTQVGWFTVLIAPKLTLVGTDVILGLYAQNDAGKAPHTGPWNYLGQSTPVADPGSGNFGRNNDGTVVRISSTDQDGLSRDGELGEITPGVELNFNDGEWIARVDTATDMTGWWEFNVTTQSGGLPNGADGIKPISWEISAPQPTDYVKVDSYWPTNQPSWATVTGLYTEEPLSAGVLSTRLGTYVEPAAAVEGDTGYGADFEFQAASVSPDWDVLAVDR